MFSVSLTNSELPEPRLLPEATRRQVIPVPVYTDFKMHDMCDAEDSSNREPLDMNQTSWTQKFQLGNCRFLTKRLWGAANEAPYWHHGLFTTMRQAIGAHYGEGSISRKAFLALSQADQDAVIEFLKTLQVLPPGTKSLIVDENHRPRQWPPVRSISSNQRPH
jgi:CxxC motif-containing protein (DUF1111 family)